MLKKELCLKKSSKKLTKKAEASVVPKTDVGVEIQMKVVNWIFVSLSKCSLLFYSLFVLKYFDIAIVWRSEEIASSTNFE